MGGAETIIKVLNNNTNYWLVRTAGGIYYDQFVGENFIAVGWNEISDIELLQKAPKDENIKERLLKSIRKFVDEEAEKDQQPKGDREREAQKSRIYNQINRFVNEMSVGDYVLIPSPRSTLIEFGIITSQAYVSDKNVADIEEGDCDWLKRRDVDWLYREKRERLDPHLFGLIYSQHAISNANEYAHYIDRTIHKLYVKNDQAHLIMEVGKETGVYGTEFIKMISYTLGLIDFFNEKTGSNYDKNQVQIKANVESPGPIELFGNIELIMIIALSISALFGASVKVKDLFRIDTHGLPGLIDKINHFIKQRQQYDLEKRRIEMLQHLQSLKVKLPPELQFESGNENLENNKNAREN